MHVFVFVCVGGGECKGRRVVEEKCNLEMAYDSYRLPIDNDLITAIII